MGSVIKNIRGNSVVEYDKGGFDDWCVYLQEGNNTRYAPRDVEYFTILRSLGTTHTCEKIYNDFVKLFNRTNSSIQPEVLDYISSLSESYGDDAEQIEIWFTVIYAGMVAEQNKAYSKLGKRIKRLGMHQVLIECKDPSYAANFSKGKPWRELDSFMASKGF